MAISEFGALTREFYIVEIGTWEIMAVSEFGEILLLSLIIYILIHMC